VSDTPEQEQDFMYNMLAGNQSGALPYWFRKKHCVASELTCAAAQTLLLANDTLGVVYALHAALDALAQPAALAIRNKVGQQVKDSAAATSLLAGSRHPLYSIAIVNLNTALESGIEDTIIVALRFLPHLIEKLAELGISCPTIPDREHDLSNDQANTLYAELEKWKRTQLNKLPKEQRKPPIGWLMMLNAIGLHVDLNDADRAALREMIYIRNSLIHRAGRADAEAATEMLAPPEPDALIEIKREDMHRFATATLSLASAIAHAVIKRDLKLTIQIQGGSDQDSSPPQLP
jgi:hypothetical protein